MAISLKSIGSKIKSTVSKVATAAKNYITGGNKTAAVMNFPVSQGAFKVAPATNVKSIPGVAQPYTQKYNTTASASNPSLATQYAYGASTPKGNVQFNYAGGGSSVSGGQVGDSYSTSDPRNATVVSSLSRGNTPNINKDAGAIITNTQNNTGSGTVSVSDLGAGSQTNFGAAPGTGVTNFTGYPQYAAGMTGQYNPDGTPKETPGETKDTSEKDNMKAYMDSLKEYMGTPERTDTAQIKEDSGLNDLLKKQSDIEAEMTAISSKAETQKLALVGQGRGIPEVIIGGQQAKIDREAAIQLMPLTAKYQAVSGNVDTAKQIVADFIADERAYQSDMRDYRKTMFNAAINYADKEQAKAIRERERKEDRQFEEEDNFRTRQQKFMEDAIDSEQPELISSLQKARNYDELATAASRIKTSNSIDNRYKQMQIKKMQAELNDSVVSNQPINVTNLQSNLSSIEKNKSALTSVFNSNKISAGSKTAIGNGLSLMTAAQDLADATASGEFAGLYPGRSVVDFLTPEAFKRAETVANEALINALNLQTQFWASGAALSDPQTLLVEGMIPTKNDTDKTVRTKVNQLVNYMLSQSSSRLITDGISFKHEPVDLFDVTLKDIQNMEDVLNN